MRNLGLRILQLPLWRSAIVRWLTLFVAALLLLSVVFAPMGVAQQTAFAGITLLIALILNRFTTSRLASLVLIVLSVTASFRYMNWRLTETLGFESLLDAALGYGLLMAEFYALIMLLLGYFQSAWPLRRKPVALPEDLNEWPTVDVFIPTYNEPLSVVRLTVITALSQDWPAEKIKIYVLDDGRREEFRDFCDSVGVGYLTRDNNRHAKAGNINSALDKTDGEFIAIFDCDHVPTRSFLQVCMGWFLKDRNLAMLQTPHVFFSPDPLEENLEVFQKVPNEGQLFYGLVQDGNDLWNATFFCGSCAILRREHLLAIGGMATESVTEDALTALKMNRAGFNTAYLGIPQAAGLATENLARHVGQRIRWARGMAQILRKFNPMAGPGLKLSQRLCYAGAALHFFYGLPRIVFLTAPLAYLFLGAEIFQAPALLIAVFVLPHILSAQITNSRLQGKYRHSLWNEVYESVLAWYIMRPTLATLVNPDSATFNVTAKGGTSDKAYFDWLMARPYIVLLVLNWAGFMVGLAMILLHWHDNERVLTALLNMTWTLHNIMICGASVAVAGEQQQMRSSPRVDASIPATLSLPDGRRVACNTIDFSQEGLGVKLPAPIGQNVGDTLLLSLFRGDEERIFPAQIVFKSDTRVGLRFQNLTLAQQIELAQMTFARADIWARTWHETTPDKPMTAVIQITRIGLHGMHMLMKESLGALRNKLRRTPQPEHVTTEPPAS